MKFLTIDAAHNLVLGVCESDLHAVKRLALRQSADARHHVEQLTPLIQEVLAEAQISRPEAIIVGTGPAAFTGLRAALVTARTLAYAWEIPLFGISSLEALALAGCDAGANLVEAIIDARRKEVYALRARALGADDVEVLREAQVVRPADLVQQLAAQPAVLVAADAQLYAAEFAQPAQRLNVQCTPEVMTRLYLSRQSRKDAGEAIDFSATPQYLRRPDVQAGNYLQPAADGNPYELNAQ